MGRKRNRKPETSDTALGSCTIIGTPLSYFRSPMVRSCPNVDYRYHLVEHLIAASHLHPYRTGNIAVDALRGPLYNLRWFTPGGEVNLCGHATLAAAHALWDEGRADRGGPVRFFTRSGILVCRRDAAGWVQMDLPSDVSECESSCRLHRHVLDGVALYLAVPSSNCNVRVLPCPVK